MKLNLTLKRKWYQLIEQGIKKEEYRDMKPHWDSRIWAHKDEITEVTFTDYVHRMTFKVEGITIGRPKREWTAFPHRTCYIIHLGDRIE